MTLADEKPWKISFFHEDWSYPNGGLNPEPVVLHATHDELIGMTEQSREFRNLLERGGDEVNQVLTGVWETYCDDEEEHFEYPGGPSFNKYFEVEDGLRMSQRLDEIFNAKDDSK